MMILVVIYVAIGAWVQFCNYMAISELKRDIKILKDLQGLK